MREIVFNKDEMQKFIDGFDPAAKKYEIDSSSCNYLKVIEYDELCKSINLKKSRIHDMIHNTNLIYGNFQQSIDYGLIYENVLNKFLLNFVCIPNLGSLYDTQYMDFEWNMHSNLDFKKHMNSYYRDHFIHQVRNMFMVLSLVDDKYIYHNIKKALTSSTRSKVTQYFNNRLNAWINNIENNRRLKDILDDISREKSNSQNEYYKQFFSNYVIRASLIISCLFHDIGYPVAHYLSVKERLINFIPAVYSVMGDNNFDFNYIYSILSESVLFQFVGKEDIYRRFNQNDHGTISAILVGIFFYKTGLIHSLSVEKQTAVELGMLAIYNHTLALKHSNPKAKTDYIKMQFTLNPISYMLRWCDDMQEWDREYFEIASVSNLLFCPKCKMPLRKVRMTPSKYFEENNINWRKEYAKKMDQDSALFRSFFSYRCMCNNNDNEYSFTKRDDFNRRRLIQIKACDNVVIKMNDDSGEGSLLIDFQYNLYKLLRLSNIHPSFIRVRQKEITAIKKFVEGQRFLDGQRGYRCIRINHNLLSNPILLKMLILKEFLDTTNDHIRRSEDDSPFSNYTLLKEIGEVYDAISSKTYKNKLKDFTDDFSKLLNKIIQLCYGKNHISSDLGIIKYNCKKYIALMACSKICLNEQNAENKEIVCKAFKRTFSEFKQDDIRKILVNDAFEQIKTSLDCDDCSKNVANGKYLFTVVSDYCDSQNEINSIKPDGEKLTYYTDLYLFEQLSYLTELLKKASSDDPPLPGEGDISKHKILVGNISSS